MTHKEKKQKVQIMIFDTTRVYNILIYCVDLKKKMTKNNNIFLKINTNN